MVPHLPHPRDLDRYLCHMSMTSHTLVRLGAPSSVLFTLHHSHQAFVGFCVF